MLNVSKSVPLALAGMKQGIKDRTPAEPDEANRSATRRAEKTKSVKGVKGLKSKSYSEPVAGSTMLTGSDALGASRHVEYELGRK